MSVRMKLDKINKLNDELEKTKKSLSKDILKQLKKLMVDNPLIEIFKWQQYTPHFNDGDVCEFGVHGLLIKFDESVQPREEDHYDDNFLSVDYDMPDDFFKKKMDIINHTQIQALDKAVEEVCDLFGALQQTDMRAEFGDGVEVVVTREGVEVTPYDHD